MLLLLCFFTFFTFFRNPKSRDFLRFLPCFVRFLELSFVCRTYVLLLTYAGTCIRCVTLLTY